MATYNFIFEMVGYDSTSKRKSYESVDENTLQKDLKSFARTELDLQCLGNSSGIDNKMIDDAIENYEIRYVKLANTLQEKIADLQEKIDTKNAEMLTKQDIEINGVVLKAEKAKKKPKKEKSGEQSKQKVIATAKQTSSTKKFRISKKTLAFEKILIPKEYQEAQKEKVQNEKLRRATRSEDVIKSKKTSSCMESEIGRREIAVEKQNLDEFFRGKKEEFYKPQTRAVRELSNYYELINQSF
jgi:hypothetical protein